jgi:hypothetical protein
LAFTPAWAVAQGVAANTGSQIPHITVEYRNSAVYVTSTHSISKVKLQFSNGNTQSFSNLSVSTGTWQGTGSNSGDTISNVWVKSWSNSNQFGTNGEPFDFTSSTTFVNALGLNNVTYPYPSGGSWSEYVNYVTSSGTDNDSPGGYRFKFGGMNLLNYWMTWYPAHSQVPDLWKTRAEPEYALKDSVGVFMNFINAVNTDDRVGLVIYDANDGNATLESPLTSNFSTITNTVNQRQAGHYTSYTNIGAGMQLGRQHLEANARTNSAKLIVLMTDGLANWHSGRYDMSGAAQMITSEASLAAADKYKYMTIALGVDADTATMQNIANTSKGKYYCVPGGSDHQAMHDQLKNAFQDIANARPLLLVK